MRTIAIIGGGVSGLISIKCCLDGGLSPTCYEMTNDIGGLWNYDANGIDGKVSVMKSTDKGTYLSVSTRKEISIIVSCRVPHSYLIYRYLSCPRLDMNEKKIQLFRFSTSFD